MLASWKRKIVANLPTSNDLKNAWISYLSTLVDDFGFVDVDEGTGTFLSRRRILGSTLSGSIAMASIVPDNESLEPKTVSLSGTELA